jgi:hypothetical protein
VGSWFCPPRVSREACPQVLSTGQLEALMIAPPAASRTAPESIRPASVRART